MKFTLFERWQVLVPSTDWLWLFIIASLLSMVIGYGAYRKLVLTAGKTISRFLILFVLNIAVMLLFFALVLPIEKLKSDEQDYVLLTSGITQQQVDALDLSHINTVFVFVSNNHFEAINFDRFDKKLAVIKTIEQLPIDNYAITHLSIVGDGLTAKQLALLTGVTISFMPSPKLTGLVDVSWHKEITLGHKLIVKGKYQQAKIIQANDDNNKFKNRIVEVALFDPFDTKITSEKLKPNESFSLIAQPKIQGRFIYRIKLINGSGDVLTDEPVAVYVKKSAKVKLLIKQSAASFETRQLKSWAGEQGALVVMQTQISKEKVISQTINLTAGSRLAEAQSFDKAYLSQFDLLVIDGRGLLVLSADEIEALHAALIKGLGLYIMVDSDLITAFENSDPSEQESLVFNLILSNFTLLSNESKNYSKTSQLVWLHSVTSSAIKISQAQLKVNNGITLVSGDQQQTIVASKNRMLGQIALSLFNQSYSLVTQRETLTYSQLWQYLIENIARADQSGYWLEHPQDNILRLGEQSSLCALTAQGDVMGNQQKLLSSQLSLTANIVNKHKYCGFIWPEQTGWLPLDLLDSDGELIDKRWFFSYENLAWAAWQQAIKHSITQQMSLSSGQRETITTSVPIDKKLIWLLLFIGLTLLWLEHKNR